MKTSIFALATSFLLACGACGGAQKSDGGSDVGGRSQPTGNDDFDDGQPGESSGAAYDDDRDDGATGDDAERNDAGEFKVNEADKSSRPTQGTIKATETEAAVRFFVVNKKTKKPIDGIVISLTSPSGDKYYTKETDGDGFAEVLVPAGQKYELVYLSLGRRDVSAKVDVANKPNLNLKLTLRYEREEYPTGEPPKLVLDGVRFETGKAKLTTDSHARIDSVAEYMAHKKSVRIEVSGHTDNVGSKRANKKLSQRRADAVRDYLIAKGVDGSRITAIGYGDERPVSPNDTEAGRQLNRRIEAREVQ